MSDPADYVPSKTKAERQRASAAGEMRRRELAEQEEALVREEHFQMRCLALNATTVDELRDVVLFLLGDGP